MGCVKYYINMEKKRGDIMKYILLGIIGFAFLFAFDYFNYKNKGKLKKLFGILSVASISLGSISILLFMPKTHIHPIIKVIGGGMTTLWGFMLSYSLFFEIPFVDTYGKEKYNGNLVKSGTYALCRHPGVLWFGLLYLSIFLTTGTPYILYGGIVWTAFDAFHVYLQEKLFFHEIFPEYKEYVRETPMLIPNRKSFQEFRKTIFKR